MPEKRSEKSDQGAADAADERVQKAADKEQEQGFLGQKVDPTPNENYTVAGVLAGKPTPESDPEARKQAQAASRGE